ncbi:hypothetical protein [Janthinobacterium sp. B9-8]|uniref:hypothetical protein n=1 Tax=Janthinobacterium sp. B9-8 TaxID=1236179 RepID=UPI00061D3C12|nr:hypothetical protein [Janthinobacterium sp. B9-8]AMC36177.1 hypothetical protein VN23_17045 [Janthinobacterium sp. B9-8]
MDETEDLEAFLEDFSKVYARLDVDGVTDMFCLPFFSLINGEKTDWPKLEELYHTTCILFDWYQQQGFHDAHYAILSMLKITPKLATARLRWRVLLTDGSPWEYCTSYQLKHIDGEWKIAGVIQFEDTSPNSLPHPFIAAENALHHLAELAEAEPALLKNIYFEAQ